MATKNQPPPDGAIPEPPDFAQLIEEFAHGSVNTTLTDRFRELIKACVSTGRKGAMVIKISVGAKGNMAQIDIIAKTNKPEPEMMGACYFATDEGGLVTEDPRQLKFPTKVLDAPSGVRIVKEV